MEDLGGATEDQVILAWLQAEIESPDFQAYVIGNPPNPASLSAVLKAARSPDLKDPAQNQLRRELITTVDVGELLYARQGAAWPILAPATRKVAEGATNVGHVFTGDQTNMVVLSLASGLCHSGKKVPEIIALRRPDGHLVIMEGHARATAIALEAHRFPKGVDAYVGDGPSVAGW